MNTLWYYNRLKKMSLAEICKRVYEYGYIFHSRLKHTEKRLYRKFVRDDVQLTLHHLPSFPIKNNWRDFKIYDKGFDLMSPIDWLVADTAEESRWPLVHHSYIDYRPGNSCGDIRINWELNRLQFLPSLAVFDERRAKAILADWLKNNPYPFGPSYVSSMEVAIRWFSIYWTISILKELIERELLQDFTGLAMVSGRFIENHLSTHSSAGNHLILESVGLFWIGKALEKHRIGSRWAEKGRRLLWEQILAQINPDGSNKEQSFWYLGFVLDAIFHYLLLEDRAIIPQPVLKRCEMMLEFINKLIAPNGAFPDYGDRDDGYVFRIDDNYDTPRFLQLLALGSHFFQRPEWFRDGGSQRRILAFWTGKAFQKNDMVPTQYLSETSDAGKKFLKTFSHGGITLLKQNETEVLFRHAKLGFGNTAGHGHADALSILMAFRKTPILIDLGSGQYNGDRDIRNYFRSTIAHNTVMVNNESQAKTLGPFLWDKFYNVETMSSAVEPTLYVEASHDGYLRRYGIIHSRKIELVEPTTLNIHDTFSGPGDISIDGAFHMGACKSVVINRNVAHADFGSFAALISFPDAFRLWTLSGSLSPFAGWRSAVYGRWELINSVFYSKHIKANDGYMISIHIEEIEGVA